MLTPERSAFDKDHKGSGTGEGAVATKARPLVLLVDDCEDTRTLYAEYLALAGFTVKEASDGLSAVRESVSTIPDVVVMDLSLPGVGGREATQRMKADPRTRAVPIVILSGFSRDVVEQDGKPWDDYIAKPCVPEELVRAIGRALHKA